MMLTIVSGHSQVTSPITFFKYSNVTPMAINLDKDYQVKVSDGKVLVTIDERQPLESTFEADNSVTEELLKIVNKYKIYNYNGSYQPSTDVRDGSMWSLYFRCEDDKSYGSSGTNAMPENGYAAISEICSLLDCYRIRMWEGTYIQNTDDNSDADDSPYTLTVGRLQSDRTFDVTFTVKDQFTLLCTGEVDLDDELNIYLRDIKNGMLPSSKQYDWSKPLFVIYKNLTLQDIQSLGISNSYWVYLTKLKK